MSKCAVQIAKVMSIEIAALVIDVLQRIPSAQNARVPLAQNFAREQYYALVEADALVTTA